MAACVLQRKQHLAAGGEPRQLQPAGGFQQFVFGLAAGTFAKLATHPLDVCKKRFQVQPRFSKAARISDSLIEAVF